MSCEISPYNTVVVMNERSGVSMGQSGSAGAIANEITRLFPQMPLYSFEQVLSHPQAIEHANVLAIGGDGTISTLIKSQKPDETRYVIPVGSGTVQTISRHMGFTQNPLETVSAFAARIATSVQNDTFTPIHHPAGKNVYSYEQKIHQEPFMFMSGVGVPSSAYNKTIESVRGTLPRTLRHFLAMIRSSQETVRSSSFAITYGKLSHAVLDVQLFKQPFARNNAVITADTKRDILMIYNDIPKPTRLYRFAMDAFCILIAKVAPKFGAISYLSIERDTPIYIQTFDRDQRRNNDSESKNGSLTKIIGTDTMSGVIYRIATPNRSV
jgi:hypothetical protein